MNDEIQRLDDRFKNPKKPQAEGNDAAATLPSIQKGKLRILFENFWGLTLCVGGMCVLSNGFSVHQRIVIAVAMIPWAIIFNALLGPQKDQV